MMYNDVYIRLDEVNEKMQLQKKIIWNIMLFWKNVKNIYFSLYFSFFSIIIFEKDIG